MTAIKRNIARYNEAGLLLWCVLFLRIKHQKEHSHYLHTIFTQRRAHWTHTERNYIHRPTYSEREKEKHKQHVNAKAQNKNISFSPQATLFQRWQMLKIGQYWAVEVMAFCSRNPYACWTIVTLGGNVFRSGWTLPTQHVSAAFKAVLLSNSWWWIYKRKVQQYTNKVSGEQGWKWRRCSIS